MNEITLTLTGDEVQTIFNVLGQMPSSSGVFPLMVKIKMQVETQGEAPVEEKAA